jgi:hypothetical protein
VQSTEIRSAHRRLRLDLRRFRTSGTHARVRDKGGDESEGEQHHGSTNGGWTGTAV